MRYVISIISLHNKYLSCLLKKKSKIEALLIDKNVKFQFKIVLICLPGYTLPHWAPTKGDSIEGILPFEVV